MLNYIYYRYTLQFICIKDNISKTIDTYEPRVSIETLLVEPNLESNGFDVRLDFQVLSRADIPPISIEFFLNRSQ